MVTVALLTPEFCSWNLVICRVFYLRLVPSAVGRRPTIVKVTILISKTKIKKKMPEMAITFPNNQMSFDLSG